MKKILIFAMLAVAAFGQEHKVTIEIVKSEIADLFELSVRQCAQFYKGNVYCVISQFRENYRFYVIRDQDRIVGPPGTPGPGNTYKEPRPCQMEAGCPEQSETMKGKK